MNTHTRLNRIGRSRVWNTKAPAIVAVLVAASLVPCVFAQQGQVPGVDAVRQLVGRKQYAEAERAAFSVIWTDMFQPETLGLLAQAVEAQKRPEEAAVWYTLMAGAAGEAGLPKAEAAKYKALADRRLKVLDKEWEQQKATYEKSAAGKKFDSPEKVDDGWMTQASAGLRPLHGLYAWKLIGGRKDRPADWIQNAQGTMHRSGLKRIDSLDGRTGILFSGVGEPVEPTENRPLVNRIGIKNIGGCRYLRIGTKGYNFPYDLKVTAGKHELLSQKIGEKQWSDLKIDLGESPAKGEQVILILSKPDGQRPIEGVWFDYVDFFVD